MKMQKGMASLPPPAGDARRECSTGAPWTALLVGVALVAEPVVLAAADAGGAALLEEIVVTSTRRTERLQETGASVSAFTGEALDARGLRTFEDLNRGVSSLHIARYQGESSVFIRGIGTPVIIAGNDSAAGTYLDGVFLSRAAAIGPTFFDIERVEVLKGPQGTLYGRNATSGAINIITRDPTETLSLEARYTAGTFARHEVFAALSGPLGRAVRARLALRAEERDGYTTGHLPRGSLAPGEPDRTVDLEDKEEVALRFKVQADLTEQAKLEFTGDYFRAEDRANVYHFGGTGYQQEVPGWLGTREGSQTLAYFALKGTGRQTGLRSRDIFVDAPYFHDTEIWGVTGELDWTVRDHDLKVIAGYKKSDPRMQNEFDLSDAYNNIYLRAEDHWQWSVEALLSSPEDRRFRWIAGAYYFEERNEITNNVFGDFWEPILIQGLTDLQAAGVIPMFPIDIPSSNLCCTLRLNGMQETEAWAIYLDTAFDLTDRLAVRLGGRYSEETRDGAQLFDLVVLPAGASGPAIRLAPNETLFPAAVSDSRDGVVPDPFGFVVAPVDGPVTFDSFTPKFGLEFQATNDVLLYASIQRGFKSGGYNIGSTQRDPFEPETIWAYEFGAKSDWLEQRLRLNLAYFHYDYKNLQAQDSVNNQPLIRNVGKAAVDGVELEFIGQPLPSLRVDGTLTWLDARFTKGELTEPLRPAPAGQPPGTLLRDLDGLRLTRAPEWKYTLGLQIDRPLGRLGDLSLRADYAWQSKVYFTVFNIDAASQDAYGLLGARARWASPDERWQVTAFAENLTDERYFTNLVLTGAFYGAEFIGPLGPPRTYGVEVSYRF